MDPDQRGGVEGHPNESDVLGREIGDGGLDQDRVAENDCLWHDTFHLDRFLTDERCVLVENMMQLPKLWCK